MSSLNCKLDSLVPQPSSFLQIMANFGQLIGNLLNDVYGKITKPLEQFSIGSMFIQTEEIQRQVLGGSFGTETFNSRLNLRAILGLSASFEDNPKAIEQLSGSVKRATNRKTNVTRLIRNMRDYDGY
ncbi:MAG: hypothetical protein ABSD92_05460 [Candidatus Bathyarchaeia archaeon]